ncbi:MAG: trypsin-like peptidase domain-containing protein [Acidisphaera sp.]|nr:trypsin-like peptidase domain-containing protein [Acidisphaera sp.]
MAAMNCARGLRVLAFTAALLLPACADARAAPDSFAPLVKRVVPAVVNIAVTESVDPSDALSQIPSELRGTPFERQFRQRLGRRREQVLGAGSGFIVDPSGIIVTNNHVVGHANKIVVSLADGTELPAKLLGSDDLTDIAVIKVSAPGPLPYVTWGDSRQVEVGDWILAAGNPFGLGGSVTAGIVSARGRDIGAGPFDDFLQLDAPINPGNSGGPTFNMEGQVVGVNTAIVSPTGGSVGIGFAIPSQLASRIVTDLRDKGRIDRGWLGVSVADMPEGSHSGVGIADVDRTGPAARAGLRPGDVVTAVNGERVDSARTLIRAVSAATPGNAVRLTLRRQGRDMELSVTVGRRPGDQG